MNAVRGDVPVEIDGQSYPLRLSLGALAEIETALGVADFAALTERLAKPSASDLLIILSALLRSGGTAMSVDDLRSKTVNLKQAIGAVAAAFSAGLGTDGETPGKQLAPTGVSGAGSASA